MTPSMFRSLHTGLILEEPKPLSVALKENATFKCLAATNVTNFNWYLNGTKCDSSTCNVEQGCSFVKKLDYNVNKTTEITVDTTYGYNSTMFNCIAKIERIQQGNYVLVDEENSTVALLTVQGMTIPVVIRCW